MRNKLPPHQGPAQATPEAVAAIPDLVATCEFAMANLASDHPLRAMAEIALRKAGRIA